MIKILFVIFMAVTIGSNDCKVEEAIVYEDINFIQRLFKISSKKNEKAINISFGYGFGDKLNVIHNDSIIFSYCIDKVDDPGISFDIQDSKGTINIFMEEENVCSSTNLLEQYEYLLISRFQNKWYFTYSHKKLL